MHPLDERRERALGTKMPRELERMMLGVPLRRPDASPIFCAALVEGLTKHILYMHQQIPCTYDELERSVAPPPPEEDGEEEPVSRVRRPTIASRKAAKLVHALGELFALLPEALSQARAPDVAGPSAAGSTVAALMLGSSPAAPRIVILLRIFPLAAGVAGPSSEAEAAAAVREGKLRVLRALTIQCGQLASVNPGLCRLHLLVQAPPDAPLPAAAFQPRPGLTLKLKRAHAVCVGVGGPASGCAVEPHEPPLRAQDWCDAPIDGLVLPPPRVPRRRRAQQMETEEGGGEEGEDDAMDSYPAEYAPMDTGGEGTEATAPNTIWFQSTAKLQAFKGATSHANGL